ncbi:hypothetical protein EDC01DRAFT_782236 [Geopyxis carbonaria]|nr:hypothetical protein EDC01DRAFT_782236 [Geopyxis carbonaria]
MNNGARPVTAAQLYDLNKTITKGNLQSSPALIHQRYQSSGRPQQQPLQATGHLQNQAVQSASRLQNQTLQTTSRPQQQPLQTIGRLQNQSFQGQSQSRPQHQSLQNTGRPQQQPVQAASRPQQQPVQAASRPQQQPVQAASRLQQQSFQAQSRARTNPPGPMRPPQQSQPAIRTQQPSPARTPQVQPATAFPVRSPQLQSASPVPLPYGYANGIAPHYNPNSSSSSTNPTNANRPHLSPQQRSAYSWLPPQGPPVRHISPPRTPLPHQRYVQPVAQYAYANHRSPTPMSAPIPEPAPLTTVVPALPSGLYPHPYTTSTLYPLPDAPVSERIMVLENRMVAFMRGCHNRLPGEIHEKVLLDALELLNCADFQARIRAAGYDESVVRDSWR